MDYSEKKYSSFEECLNEIGTYLVAGEMWHERSANESRKMAVRGWGRWHDAESCGDKKIYSCLSKIVMDKLGHHITLNPEKINKAMMYSINDLKTHHNDWIDREEHLIKALNEAIEMSRKVDMQLYKKLCEIIDEVQNEKMRVKMILSNLNLTNWNGHDVSVKSKWLHDYFEKDYDGKCIDFNIG